jgi:thiol-disulfide isomerase/thioredoxin
MATRTLPLLGAALLLLSRHAGPAHAAAVEPPLPAPAFTHTRADDWIGSPPLTWGELRGKVVLLDFWTFDCWNCYRSFPWLTDLEARYADDGLVVVGVHAPEFDHERVKANVEAKVAELGLHHPVMLDNDFSFWHAMGNRYWPTFYLVDKEGLVRARFIGEVHAGDAQARDVEDWVQRLLAQ